MSCPEAYRHEGSDPDKHCREVSICPDHYGSELSGQEIYEFKIYGQEGACSDTKSNEVTGPETWRHEGSCPDSDSHKVFGPDA